MIDHQCGSCADTGCTGLCRQPRPGDGASMTIAEAEAWRAGWRAAIDAAAKEPAEAIDADHAAERIRALEPPEPYREPSGWSYRG